jgi:type II secretion system protein C
MKRAVLCALLLSGCATAKPAPDGEHLLDEKKELASPAAAPAPTTMTPGAAPAAAPGVISRAQLDEVLSASPGAFLQHVDSAPRFRGGRFAGWRLVAFFPGDSRFRDIDLRAGDVVLRVNGSTVERPEELMRLWQELRSAHELVIDIERDGQPRRLRWTISP